MNWEQLETRQKEIFKKYSCSPTLTMLIPAVSQLPLFVFSTALFSSVATRPTPLDDESFLTLTSLARPDPTGTLPVVLGLVTLANVETAGWFVGAERAARTAAIEARQQAQDEKTREAGGIVKPRTKNVVQSSLRALSIVRIVIGIMVDGVCSFSQIHRCMPSDTFDIVCARVLAVFSNIWACPILGV